MKTVPFRLILYIYLTSIIWTLDAQNPESIPKSLVTSNALSRLNLLDENHSIFDLIQIKESNIAAITQLKVFQRYGDTTYDKFEPFSILRFYGFTGFNMAIRTRQQLEVPVLTSYLVSAIKKPDVNGKDINAHPEAIIASNTTRFGLFFNPFNSASRENLYGIIEFDFAGIVPLVITTLGASSPITTYSAKIRHTFGEYLWYSGSLLFGQFFHPLFLPESFPRTVNSNMGAAFEPQALVPQFRLTQMLGNIELIMALAGEGYIYSWSERGALPNYLQDAIIPNLHLQLKWRSGRSFLGGAIDFKRLVPRLRTETNYKVNEYIDSLIGELFIHNVFWWGELNVKTVYAENGSDQLLLSGFGVRTNEPITNFQTYSNTAAISTWIDTFCVFFSDSMSLGLFVGYAKNLGSRNALYKAPGAAEPIVYSFEQTTSRVDYTFRISPRFLYARGAFRFGTELTWDKTAYGTLDKYGRVINPHTVHSFSYEMAFNYVF